MLAEGGTEPFRFQHDLVEQGLAYPMLQQPLSVFAEDGSVEAGLEQVHAQKPPEEEVVIQLLAESPFTADRVQGDEKGSFQEPLRMKGRSAHLSIHSVELW